MKTCGRCGVAKPLDEFHRAKRKRDGRQSRCKACAKADRATYYAANREAALERQRVYKRANREVAAGHQRKYRAANRETCAERDRAYRQAHREAIAERDRAYRQAHPHVNWESFYRQRARRYGFAPVVESFTRADLIARYGDACFHCGGDFDELDHHPIAVRDGGPHTLDNVRPSCTPCNRGRNQAAA